MGNLNVVIPGTDAPPLSSHLHRQSTSQDASLHSHSHSHSHSQGSEEEQADSLPPLRGASAERDDSEGAAQAGSRPPAYVLHTVGDSMGSVSCEGKGSDGVQGSGRAANAGAGRVRGLGVGREQRNGSSSISSSSSSLGHKREEETGQEAKPGLVDPPPLQGAVDGGGTGGEEGQGRGGGAMSWAGQASAVTRQKGREEQGGMAGLGAQLNVSSEKLRCSPVLDDKSLAPPVYSQARYVCACFVCVCVCVCTSFAVTW